MGNNKWWSLQRKPEDYELGDTVKMAKLKLCEKFNVKMEDFEKKTSRKANVIEARRFLIYFLVRDLEVRPSHVKWFIPSLQNHATALHHLKKMEHFMLNEIGKADEYLDFRDSMLLFYIID